MAKTRKKASLVMAGLKPSLPKKLELSTFKCGTCSSTFVTNSKEPYCPHCHANTASVVADANIRIPANEDDLVAVQCSCEAYTIMNRETASAHNGHAHCVTCGASISWSPDQLDADDEDFDPDCEDDDSCMDTEDDDSDEDEVSEEDTAGSEEGESDDEDEDQGESDDEDEDQDESDDEDEDQDESDDEDVARSKAPRRNTQRIRRELNAEAEPETTDDTELDLVDSLPEETELSFVALSGDKVLACNGDVVVATIVRNEKTPHLDIFATQNYMRALATCQQAEGAHAALASFGFKPVRIPVSARVLARRKIAQATKEARARVLASNTDFKAQLKHALEVAAAGLNKSFFEGHNHPLKEALVKELRTAGVRNPRQFIDTAMAASSDDYHRSLFTVADGLMAKSPEVRNELAKTILASRYTATSGTTGDEGVEGEEDDRKVTEALETGFRPAPQGVKKNRQHSSTDTAGSDLASAGGFDFKNLFRP